MHPVYDRLTWLRDQAQGRQVLLQSSNYDDTHYWLMARASSVPGVYRFVSVYYNLQTFCYYLSYSVAGVKKMLRLAVNQDEDVVTQQIAAILADYSLIMPPPIIPFGRMSRDRLIFLIIAETEGEAFPDRMRFNLYIPYGEPLESLPEWLQGGTVELERFWREFNCAGVRDLIYEFTTPHGLELWVKDRGMARILWLNHAQILVNPNLPPREPLRLEDFTRGKVVNPYIRKIAAMRA